MAFCPFACKGCKMIKCYRNIGTPLVFKRSPMWAKVGSLIEGLFQCAGMRSSVLKSTRHRSHASDVHIQLLLCMKSKPQLASEWVPSRDWMKAHPWLTNDILSFQSAGGGGGQACQLPATAETPLVNLPLAGLNKIWNVKSPAHHSFFTSWCIPGS